MDNFLIVTIWFIIGGNDHNFICHHIKGIKNSLRRWKVPHKRLNCFIACHKLSLEPSTTSVLFLSWLWGWVFWLWVSASSAILLCIPISPYKYLLVASPASPICTMKPRYQYIFGNLYSQGRFAEKQFQFLLCTYKTKLNLSRWNCDYQGCCYLTNFNELLKKSSCT